MTANRFVFYYLTEDVNNLKELNEIEYLTRVGRVVVVSADFNKTRIEGVKTLILKPQSSRILYLSIIWSKICYLLCHIPKSATDREFPSRNLYSGTKLVRKLVNLIWRIKLFPQVNRFLLTFDVLYFAPYYLWAWLRGIAKVRRKSFFHRVIVHDSLALRLTKFSPMIVQARRSGVQTIANVKSWDNPFYAQFVTRADGYFVWSQSMWQDIQNVHNIDNRNVHVWGARPFFKFTQALAASNTKTKVEDGRLIIGYAAAFCDPIMVKHEISVLLKISSEIERALPDATICVRPYPIIPISDYDALRAASNIELIGIKGELTDRYGDGGEFIRFGSNEERIEYLSKCDCFLSMATSFTIEAALFGLPIVHFFLQSDLWKSPGELSFFQRIEISEHITDYFVKDLTTAETYEELSNLLSAASQNRSTYKIETDALLARIGLPSNFTNWDKSDVNLAADLKCN